MIYIWSGRGWLVPVNLLVAFVPFLIIVTQSETDDSGRSIYFQEHWWWLTGLSFLLAGIINFFVGRYLHGRPGQVFLDAETGLEFRLRHTLYWIKMEYWGLLFVATGIAFFAAKFLAH